MERKLRLPVTKHRINHGSFLDSPVAPFSLLGLLNIGAFSKFSLGFFSPSLYVFIYNLINSYL